MKISFSTLACPDWTLPNIVSMASAAGYDGIELRFVENEDSLWKLSVFQGNALARTKRTLSDLGLAIPCVGTSCRFHFPDPRERARWLEAGERMADLAAALGAPGIRVTGDTIQPGAERASTRAWIAESLHWLAEKTAARGVEVWLETHGDFARASDTAAILAEAKDDPAVGVVWDPANCFLECGEKPCDGAAGLASSVRHVHIKDLIQNPNGWKPVLTGEGNFPLQEVQAALCQLEYKRFLSFEWEKKWYPEIPDATVVLPHFARWFRESFEK
jgi:sugar phosphate isomerase/epimerase